MNIYRTINYALSMDGAIMKRDEIMAFGNHLLQNTSTNIIDSDTFNDKMEIIGYKGGEKIMITFYFSPTKKKDYYYISDIRTFIYDNLLNQFQRLEIKLK